MGVSDLLGKQYILLDMASRVHHQMNSIDFKCLGMALQEGAQKAVRLQQELKRVVGEAAEAQRGLVLHSANNKASPIAEAQPQCCLASEHCT